jgi:glycosyltransferase involved in cell wall biosynthesis
VITLLIPARDEATAIAGVVRRAGDVLAGEEHEVLVVDDGSRDGTGERAREAGARVLALSGLGYGAAVKAGARVAQGGLLVLLDGDGSYPEAAIPALLAAVRRGARQAIGARPPFSRAESLLRSVMKAAFRWAVRRLGGLAVPDLNSGLRVVRRADVLRLEAALPDRFSLSTTLTLALAAEGEAPAFVAIDYAPRMGRSKWRAIRDTWLMARTVTRAILWLRNARSRRVSVAVEASVDGTPPGNVTSSSGTAIADARGGVAR